jgi:hypothetical protein
MDGMMAKKIYSLADRMNSIAEKGTQQQEE